MIPALLSAWNKSLAFVFSCRTNKKFVCESAKEKPRADSSFLVLSRVAITFLAVSLYHPESSAAAFPAASAAWFIV